MFIFVAKVTKYIDIVHFHRQKCLEKPLKLPPTQALLS